MFPLEWYAAMPTTLQVGASPERQQTEMNRKLRRTPHIPLEFFLVLLLLLSPQFLQVPNPQRRGQGICFVLVLVSSRVGCLNTHIQSAWRTPTRGCHVVSEKLGREYVQDLLGLWSGVVVEARVEMK